MTERARTPEPSEATLSQAFETWFRQGGCDFWSESNAPEELAKIAARVGEAAVAKERARCLRIVDRRYWPTFDELQIALEQIEHAIRSGGDAP